MQRVMSVRLSCALGAIVGVSAFVSATGAAHVSAAPPSQAAGAPAAATASVDSQIERLKGMVPDQSHAMADVGYHFANLWFAGGRSNWPLAKFCFDETRSHLRWAVRIIPVRKSPTGQDLDMKSLLDAVDSGYLSELGKAIDASDRTLFVTAYKNALEGCYSCHKSSGKPYLRPQLPSVPAAPILNFDPAARWPE